MREGDRYKIEDIRKEKMRLKEREDWEEKKMKGNRGYDNKRRDKINRKRIRRRIVKVMFISKRGR